MVYENIFHNNIFVVGFVDEILNITEEDKDEQVVNQTLERHLILKTLGAAGEFFGLSTDYFDQGDFDPESSQCDTSKPCKI